MSPAATSTDLCAPSQLAGSLLPLIRENRDRIEHERRLPTPVVAALTGNGLFQLMLPTAVGGRQCHPLEAFEVTELLASADGSVGWCVSIANAVSLVVGAWLEPGEVKAMFGDPPDARIAGSVRPEGVATRTSGGYRVSGRWDFASGIQHANWLYCSCKLTDDDGPLRNPDGSPQARTFMVPREAARVIETWDAAGMRGSGSHDFEVHEVLVPESRGLSANEPARAEGLLYHPRLVRISGWAATAGVSLGLAKGALETLIALGNRGTTMSPAALRNRPAVQAAAGQAAAIIGSARGYLISSITGAFEAVQASCDAPDSPDPGPAVAQARLSITHAMHEAVRAVDLLFHAAGTQSVYRRNLIERYWRDVHVARQHASAMPAHIQTAGKSVLGISLDEPGW